MDMIRKLLGTPIDQGNVQEVAELAHAIMMGSYSVAQKKIALRKLDEITGTTDQPVDEAAIISYINDNA